MLGYAPDTVRRMDTVASRLKWARREKDSRVVTFTPPGERELRDRFAIRLKPL